MSSLNCTGSPSSNRGAVWRSVLSHPPKFSPSLKSASRWPLGPQLGSLAQGSALGPRQARRRSCRRRWRISRCRLAIPRSRPPRAPLSSPSGMSRCFRLCRCNGSAVRSPPQLLRCGKVLGVFIGHGAPPSPIRALPSRGGWRTPRRSLAAPRASLSEAPCRVPGSYRSVVFFLLHGIPCGVVFHLRRLAVEVAAVVAPVGPCELFRR